MRIPFSREQFAGVFALYNESVWPLQWLLIALAVIVIMLAVHRTAGTARAATVALAAIWLWCGVVYHLEFFSRINPAAKLFGTAFVIEAALLLWMVPKPSWRVLAIPLVWALVGTTAAFQLGMLEDLGMAASAIIVLYVMLSQHHAHRLAATPGS